MKFALISPMKSVKLRASRRDVFSIPHGSDHSDVGASNMAENQDSTPAKTCTICKQSKPLTAFSPNKNGRLGRQPCCRSCTNAKQKIQRASDPNRKVRQKSLRDTPEAKERRRICAARHNAKPEVKARRKFRAQIWKAANKPRLRAAYREYQLRTLYGLTTEQFEAMREAQNDRCAICDKKFKRPYVDHDHTTGEVRGLLCNGCNMGLGQMERPGFLAACTQYLERHKRSKLRAV